MSMQLRLDSIWNAVRFCANIPAKVDPVVDCPGKECP